MLILKLSLYNSAYKVTAQKINLLLSKLQYKSLPSTWTRNSESSARFIHMLQDLHGSSMESLSPSLISQLIVRYLLV